MITSKPKIILIGASTGGIESLNFILKDLPANSPPLIISQHILPNFCQSFSNQLFKISGRPTQIITEPVELNIGHIYIQQPESNLSFNGFGNKIKATPIKTFGVSIFRPCIDEMFLAYNKNTSNLPSCLAIVLTGMGADGALGLLALKKSKHLTITQDQATSIVYGMPKAAKLIGASTIEMSLTSIKENIRFLSQY